MCSANRDLEQQNLSNFLLREKQNDYDGNNNSNNNINDDNRNRRQEQRWHTVEDLSKGNEV